MKALAIFLIVILSFFNEATASSPIAYNAILAMVVIELVFAFSVGLTCVIFSFNLLRTLKAPDAMENIPNGNLPPSRIGSFSNLPPQQDIYNPLITDYRTFNENSMQQRRISTGSEMDVEEQIPGYTGYAQNSLVGIIYTFSGYLRLW